MGLGPTGARGHRAQRGQCCTQGRAQPPRREEGEATQRKDTADWGVLGTGRGAPSPQRAEMKKGEAVHIPEGWERGGAEGAQAGEVQGALLKTQPGFRVHQAPVPERDCTQAKGKEPPAEADAPPLPAKQCSPHSPVLGVGSAQHHEGQRKGTGWSLPPSSAPWGQTQPNPT